MVNCIYSMQIIHVFPHFKRWFGTLAFLPLHTPKFWLGRSREDDRGTWDWRKTLKEQEDFKWKQRLEEATHVKAKGQEIQWETRVKVKKSQQIEGPDHLHKELVFNSLWNGEITGKFWKWERRRNFLPFSPILRHGHKPRSLDIWPLYLECS